MKNWKSFLIAVLGFFTLSGMVFFSSCEKDPCLELSCQNGGNCSDGYCQCPTGYEGTECDITFASKFVGIYPGIMQCGNDPATPDSVIIELVNIPDEVRVSIGSSNPALQNLTGKVNANEATFNTQAEDGSNIHIYFTLNGSQISLYLGTVSEAQDTGRTCFFSGSRLITE